MKTDKQIYLIFQARPDWLFELTGMPSPGKCELRSLTVKALERTADGLVVPEAGDQKLSLIEFQFQPDAQIYLRVIEEMTAAQRAYGMRDIQGFIFFAKSSMDPQTDPWRLVVKTFVLRDTLLALERREPQHPLVAVFKPLLETDNAIVETQAATYYRAIKAGKLKAEIRATLLEVFVSWLEQRLPSKGRKELEMMLIGELPDLEDTQCGKDLIQAGEERGMANAIAMFLQVKFGRVSKAMRTQLGQLSPEDAKELAAKFSDWQNLREVKQWLDQRSK